MTMEQSRRLAALEARFDAMEAADIANRVAWGKTLLNYAHEIAMLRRAVADLEREQRSFAP